MFDIYYNFIILILSETIKQKQIGDRDMLVRVKGTDEIVELVYRDFDTGLNVIEDFLGSGADEFDYNDDDDCYECDRETFEHWENLGDAQYAADLRAYNLKLEHGADAVDEALKDVGYCELNDLPSMIHKALDDNFGEQK